MYMLSLLLFYTVPVLGIIIKDPPPSPNDYKYSYNIEDPSTGDSKSQHEVRLGDVVRGAYSVVDPDGKKRTVVYTADAKHGFKAIVRDEPAEAIVVSTPTSIIRKQEPYVREYQPSYPEVLNSAGVDYYERANNNVEPNYFFTPVDEIKPEFSAFKPGQYFLTAP